MEEVQKISKQDDFCDVFWLFPFSSYDLSAGLSLNSPGFLFKLVKFAANFKRSGIETWLLSQGNLSEQEMFWRNEPLQLLGWISSLLQGNSASDAALLFFPGRSKMRTGVII